MTALLLVDPALEPALRAAGLDRAEGWEARLASAAGSGRGGTVRADLGGARLVLKRMRRGGVAGPLWGDRYPGTARLRANLDAPAEALRRGVPTAAAAALLLVEGPPGLHRGWLATHEISGARDLAAVLRAGEPPRDQALRAGLSAVRILHDAGIAHPDLNLGNVLVRGTEGFVIDLDRAAFGSAPLPPGRRVHELRRMMRSHAKLIGPVPDARRWLVHYAAGDRALLASLERAARSGRLWAALRDRTTVLRRRGP